MPPVIVTIRRSQCSCGTKQPKHPVKEAGPNVPNSSKARGREKKRKTNVRRAKGRKGAANQQPAQVLPAASFHPARETAQTQIFIITVEWGFVGPTFPTRVGRICLFAGCSKRTPLMTIADKCPTINVEVMSNRNGKLPTF